MSGDKYCYLCLEEKLAEDSDENPNNLRIKRKYLIFVDLRKVG